MDGLVEYQSRLEHIIGSSGDVGYDSQVIKFERTMAACIVEHHSYEAI